MSNGSLSTVFQSQRECLTEVRDERQLPFYHVDPQAAAIVAEQTVKESNSAARNDASIPYPNGDAANSGSVLTSTSVWAPSAIAKLHAKRIPSRVFFVTRQEWEGVVSSIDHDKFTARLTDVTGLPTTPQEEADFPLELVSEDDRDLLAPGAIFRWSIGYQRLPSGTKQLISQIVFRRLPQWTARDIARADEILATLAAHFSSRNGD